MNQCTLTIREEAEFTRLLVFEPDSATGQYNGYLVEDGTEEDGDSLVEKLPEFDQLAEDMLPWALSIVMASKDTYDREPVQ